MDWDNFYAEFYDWSDKTQKKKILELESFGSSDEVAEIAQELTDEKTADIFIKKAIDAKVRFTPEEIMDIIYCVSDDIHPILLKANSERYTQEDIENLLDVVDDELLYKISEKYKICCPELEEIYDDSDDKGPKLGFFSSIFIFDTVCKLLEKFFGK